MWILKVGDLFDERYRILRDIGSGGMSHVYAARDEELQETVALKVIRPEIAEDDEFVTRFKREVRIARQLRHPNIIHVYEFGAASVEGRRFYYLTMELLEGMDLASWMKAHEDVRLGEVLHLVRQLCDALAEAHRRGVVHRDIKPQNVFVDERLRLKLMDFGISRLTTLPSVTQGSKLIGTPKYMSPEQVHRRRDPDQRSDIYSVGVVLYELATGRAPFEGENPVEVAIRQMEQRPPRPREVNPLVPGPLESVIMTCLEKEPEHRYATAEALRSALGTIADEPERPLRAKASAPGRTSAGPLASPTAPTIPTPESARGRPDDGRRADRTTIRLTRRLASPRVLVPALALFLLGAIALFWPSGPGEVTAPPSVQEPEPVPTALGEDVVPPSPAPTDAAPEPEPPEPAAESVATPPAAQAAADAPAAPAPPRRASLEVDSMPAGARLVVDGTPVGTTPWSGSIAPGTHRLELEAEGHEPERLTVSLEAGRSLRQTVRLRPLPRVAPVRITANPGTEVFVDGRSLGTIPPVIRTELSVGEHRVRYVIPDYAEHEEVVPIAPGENELAHHFPPYGGLRIVAQPYARVVLDGRDLGFTPVNLERIAEGPHRLVLRRDGFRTIEKTVTVEPGRRNLFRFELEPEP